MRSNIKGRRQPGHRWESFHWFIVYTVPAIDHSQSYLILDTQASKQTLCHLATGSCTIQQRAFGRKYSSCKICFNVLNCVFITRHSLVERRARYLVYCMFVCSSTISRQPAGRFTPKFACGRTLVPDVSSPLLGVGGPRRAEKGANEIFVTIGVNGEFLHFGGF